VGARTQVTGSDVNKDLGLKAKVKAKAKDSDHFFIVSMFAYYFTR